MTDALKAQISDLVKAADAEYAKTKERAAGAVAALFGAVEGALMGGQVDLVLEAGGWLARAGLQRMGRFPKLAKKVLKKTKPKRRKK
jgi:hypothetical protein